MRVGPTQAHRHRAGSAHGCHCITIPCQCRPGAVPNLRLLYQLEGPAAARGAPGREVAGAARRHRTSFARQRRRIAQTRYPSQLAEISKVAAGLGPRHRDVGIPGRPTHSSTPRSVLCHRNCPPELCQLYKLGGPTHHFPSLTDRRHNDQEMPVRVHRCEVVNRHGGAERGLSVALNVNDATDAPRNGPLAHPLELRLEAGAQRCPAAAYGPPQRLQVDDRATASAHARQIAIGERTRNQTDESRHALLDPTCWVNEPVTTAVNGAAKFPTRERVTPKPPFGKRDVADVDCLGRDAGGWLSDLPPKLGDRGISSGPTSALPAT